MNLDSVLDTLHEIDDTWQYRLYDGMTTRLMNGMAYTEETLV